MYVPSCHKYIEALVVSTHGVIFRYNEIKNLCYTIHTNFCFILLRLYLIKSQKNTFQLVLATDGNRSFAIFLYLDEGIQWPTEDGGSTEAQVGYDAGDYINYYTVNGSMTPSIVDIETTSNVGIQGMYIFEVDGNYTGMPSVVVFNGEIFGNRLNTSTTKGKSLPKNFTSS